MFLSDLIKKSFDNILKNPSILFFLTLFLIVTNILGAYIVTSGNILIIGGLLVCLILIISAFLSGWFNIIKETGTEYKEKNYFGLFLEGIGENFISTTLGLIFYFVLFGITIFAAKLLAAKIFGNMDFITNEMFSNITTNENGGVSIILNNLTTNQKYTIYGWQMTFIVAMAIFNFMIMFYFPAIVYCDCKNKFLKPVMAIKNCIVFIFKNFIGAVAITAIIHICHFILVLLSAISSRNPIAYIIILILYLYFLSITVMVLFNYYDKNNNRNNRSDSIGENSISN